MSLTDLEEFQNIITDLVDIYAKLGWDLELISKNNEVSGMLVGTKDFLVETRSRLEASEGVIETVATTDNSDG